MAAAIRLQALMTSIVTGNGAFLNAADATLTIDGLNQDVTLNSATTPPVTKVAANRKTLSSGAGTLDLTALPGQTPDETVNGTGLKVQVAFFYNPATNANDMTITFGASNPYNLLGAAFEITLKPGQWAGPFYLADASPDVGSGAKNIDIAGTGSQVLSYLIAMG